MSKSTDSTRIHSHTNTELLQVLEFAHKVQRPEDEEGGGFDGQLGIWELMGPGFQVGSSQRHPIGYPTVVMWVAPLTCS